MKRHFWLLLILFPVLVEAQDSRYPWDLTLFGGGALLCDESGCFGPTGYAVGGAFGRQFTDRWAFELEGALARSTETLAPRFDIPTGILFVPEFERTRVWAGFTFLGTLARFGETSNFFISLGLVGAFERQKEIVPEGVFGRPDRTLGLKGGVSGGAGMNLWFSENWGIRPEAKYYVVANPLSGFRYTGGIVHRF